MLGRGVACFCCHDNKAVSWWVGSGSSEEAPWGEAVVKGGIPVLSGGGRGWSLLGAEEGGAVTLWEGLSAGGRKGVSAMLATDGGLLCGRLGKSPSPPGGLSAKGRPLDSWLGGLLDGRVGGPEDVWLPEGWSRGLLLDSWLGGLLGGLLLGRLGGTGGVGARS